MKVNPASLANLKPWAPGQSGNPTGAGAGRPIGSLTLFSNAYLANLAEVWAKKGKEAMEWTADNQPASFFAVCSRHIPQNVQLSIEQNYGGLDENDLAVLRAIKEAIPNANSRSPTEVLEYARDTLRAADAKTITVHKTVGGDTSPTAK
jgi:hypothetical protein